MAAATTPEDSDRTGVGIIPRHPSQDEIVDALEASWRALISFAANFDEQQWNKAAPLPGWSVRDIYAHILGTEKMLAGEPTPDVEIGSPAHVHNDIGRTNEAWVKALAPLSPSELLAEFEAVTTSRVSALRAMSESEWTQPSWTPAGDASIGRWMHIRVFDCWTHEQDVRVALGLPGGLVGPAADLSLAEVVIALGYIVGKRGEAPEGARVEFRLRDGDRMRLLRVQVDGGRANVVPRFAGGPEGGAGTASTTLHMPTELFMRLVAGRRNASDALSDGLIELDGNARVGERIARNLAFTV